jgi:hypothetical protein
MAPGNLSMTKESMGICPVHPLPINFLDNIYFCVTLGWWSLPAVPTND